MTDLPLARASVAPTFPGAVGISLLTVYRSGSVDGHAGGSPHVHLVCSEAYYVIAGQGTVQTLTSSGFRETPLRPGAVVHFTPGTIHRLVNHGDLRILVIMQNSGLPEAGDAVLTLPGELLQDRHRYEAAAYLPPGDEARAAVRRDLAVEGFTHLVDAYRSDGRQALAPFFAAAAALAAPKLDRWREDWLNGAERSARATGDQLDALRRGDLSYLEGATLQVEQGPVDTGRLGMCGHLEVYPAVRGT